MLLVHQLNKWKIEKYVLKRAKVEQNAHRLRDATSLCPLSSLSCISFWKPAVICFYFSERAPFFSLLSAGGDVLIQANLQWREKVEWPQRTHFLIECARLAGLNTPLINCSIKLIWALNHVCSSPCAFCKPLRKHGHIVSAGIDSGKKIYSFYYDKACA